MIDHQGAQPLRALPDHNLALRKPMVTACTSRVGRMKHEEIGAGLPG